MACCAPWMSERAPRTRPWTALCRCSSTSGRHPAGLHPAGALVRDRGAQAVAAPHPRLDARARVRRAAAVGRASTSSGRPRSRRPSRSTPSSTCASCCIRWCVEVNRTFGQTAHLAVLSGPMIVYVDKLEADIGVRITSVVGGRNPAHATGVGKALLAHELPDDTAVRRWVAANGPLAKRTGADRDDGPGTGQGAAGDPPVGATRSTTRRASSACSASPPACRWSSATSPRRPRSA